MLRSAPLILCALISFSALAEEQTCPKDTGYDDAKNQSCCSNTTFSDNIQGCCNSENIVRNIASCCTQENYEKGNPFGCCTHIPELRSASNDTPWLDGNVGLCAAFCSDAAFRSNFPILCTHANTLSAGKLYTTTTTTTKK